MDVSACSLCPAYSTIKVWHIGFVVLSGAGFLWRAGRALCFSPAPRSRLLRWLPHLIDTGLLVAGLSLLWLVGMTISATPWLQAKLGGLFIHIVAGAFALKRAKTRQGRMGAFLLSFSAFMYIVGVALAKSPASWWVWMGGTE